MIHSLSAQSQGPRQELAEGRTLCEGGLDLTSRESVLGDWICVQSQRLETETFDTLFVCVKHKLCYIIPSHSVVCRSANPYIKLRFAGDGNELFN